MFSRRAHLETFANALGLHVLSVLAWIGYFPVPLALPLSPPLLSASSNETESESETETAESESSVGTRSRDSGRRSRCRSRSCSCSHSHGDIDGDSEKDNGGDKGIASKTKDPPVTVSFSSSSSSEILRSEVDVESKRLHPQTATVSSSSTSTSLQAVDGNPVDDSGAAVQRQQTRTRRSSQRSSENPKRRSAAAAGLGSVVRMDANAVSARKPVSFAKLRHPLSPVKTHAQSQSQSQVSGTALALAQPLEAVVFGGGGARGWAFLGALDFFFKTFGIDWGARRPAIKVAAGTSIGCIPALAIVLGFSYPDLYAFFWRTDETRLLSMNAALLLSRNALNDGTAMREHISSMIYEKLRVSDISLGGLKLRTGMDLRVATYDLTHGRNVHLSGTDTPHVSTVDAVFASLAVPLLFPPMTLRLLPPSPTSTASASATATATAKTDRDGSGACSESEASAAASAAISRRAAARRARLTATDMDSDFDFEFDYELGSGVGSGGETGPPPHAFFQPCVCVDGGLGDNLCLREFAPGTALGLRLDWDMPALGVGDLNSLYSLAMRGCVAAMFESARLEMRSFDDSLKAHILSLGTGASPLISSSAEDAKRARTQLFEKGRDAAMMQLQMNPALAKKLLRHSRKNVS